jgi:pimeloyl-ACP methyl ester carboxylesterase
MSTPRPTNESPAADPGNNSSISLNPLGPVVVFVPGLGLDSRSWRRVRHGLRGPSAVELLPSMGQRAQRPTDLSVESQAARLLKSLPSGQATVLVAHSAGCPVVVEAARRARDVVGVVLVGPVTDPAARTWPRMLAQWARTACHERPTEAPELAPQYRHTGILSMLRGMDQMRRFRTDLAVARLTMPVEIVRGDKDRIASHEWSSALRQACNGTLTTIHGAAHMVPLTHPHAVVAAVDRLGRALDRGPARPG